MYAVNQGVYGIGYIKTGLYVMSDAGSVGETDGGNAVSYSY